MRLVEGDVDVVVVGIIIIIFFIFRLGIDHYIKGYPRTGHADPEGEYRYSSTLSLTFALDVVGWSTPRLGRVTLGKDPVPTV